MGTASPLRAALLGVLLLGRISSDRKADRCEFMTKLLWVGTTNARLIFGGYSSRFHNQHSNVRVQARRVQPPDPGPWPRRAYGGAYVCVVCGVSVRRTLA